MEEEQPLEESEGSEGRQREKLGWDAASIAASAGPPGKLWGRVAVRSTPRLEHGSRVCVPRQQRFSEQFLSFSVVWNNSLPDLFSYNTSEPL